MRRRIQAQEVEDDWVLLSVGSENKEQPAPEVRAKARDFPVPKRILGQGRAGSSSPEEVGGSSCLVPEFFPLSPTSSPKHAADFTPAPPAARPTVPTSASVDEAAAKKLPPGLHRRVQPAAENKVFTTLATRTSPTLEEMEDSWCHVSATPATAARHFAISTFRRHPRTAQNLLRTWFAILVLGELGTTLWWFHSLGFRGLMVLCAPAGLGLSFGLLTFGPEQMVAIAVAVSLAAMPALPAYSAVLLMTTPGGSPQKFDSCWDIIHWPMLVVLGMNYLVSALVPAVRAEYPVPKSMAHTALQSLELAQQLTRSACIISGWLYLAVVLHVGSSRLLTWGQHSEQQHTLWHYWGGAISEPLLRGQGWVLTLHAVGLMCAAIRQRTVKELGQDLLPRLLGDQRAQALTPRALIMHHGYRFLKRVPQLRRYTPPPMVVALVLAVRRTAPVLFPGLAILPQLAGPGTNSWPALSLLLGLTMLVVLALAAAHEKRSLPRSSLRRLPLLLPSGIAPCTRKLLGYALVAAEGVERARGGIASLRTHLKQASARQ